MVDFEVIVQEKLCCSHSSFDHEHLKHEDEFLSLSFELRPNLSCLATLMLLLFGEEREKCLALLTGKHGGVDFLKDNLLPVYTKHTSKFKVQNLFKGHQNQGPEVPL